MSRPSLPALSVLLAALAACGGGGGAPSGGTPVGPTHSVRGAVFYDQNGNGSLDAGEDTRVPDATVEVGGRSGRSSKVLGEFAVEGVPAGTATVTVRAASLPPYWVPPAPRSVTVPLSEGVLLPVTLPIGPNRPNVYMAFGDSITAGLGSSDERGYRFRLQDRLAAHFGRGTLVDEGIPATRSNRGAVRIDDSLYRVRPAFTLIHYGTNDWNVGECKFEPPCFTIDSLRDIVLSARGSQSLPVLSTIIPGNPDSLQQPDRNEWTAAQNERIKRLAREMNVPLADPHALFLRDASPARLFVDHVHPSDSGYELMAQAFFAALATPAEASASGYVPALLSAPGPPRRARGE